MLGFKVSGKRDYPKKKKKNFRNEEGNKQHLWEIILNRNEDMTVAVLIAI